MPPASAAGDFVDGANRHVEEIGNPGARRAALQVDFDGLHLSVTELRIARAAGGELVGDCHADFFFSGLWLKPRHRGNSL